MTTTYAVLSSFGRHGTAWVERDTNETDRKTTIRDIASGEIGGSVIQVLAINVEEKTCFDVTDEIVEEAERIKRAREREAA